MGGILFLAHRLPYPPDRGDRIRSWHVLKRLAQIAPVHVVAPIDHDDDRAHVKTVASVAASVTVALRGSKLLAMARALIRGTPASVEAFAVPELETATRAILRDHDISTIFAFSGQMAHYVPTDLGERRFVMDFVDMDSAKFAAFGGFANTQEAKRLLKWEIATADRADACAFVSEAEAALFSAKTGRSANVIENGVDAAHFDPETVAPVAAPHPLIVFTGQMDYRPNIDAVTAFARDVMPMLPEVVFAIVGRAPAPEVRALGGNVIVTGEVPDTRPWLAAADIVAAPLTLTRGVQNKVLEAMAMARPVVLTSMAAEGIDAVSDEHFIIADGAAATAQAVRALLDDPAAAIAIGSAARARVIERYDWDACLAPLKALVAP